VKTLIVDDDITSRKIMQAMLAPFGECALAANGDEAIELFRAEMEKLSLFDLVCLDIMMPGVSGHDVLKAIRAIEEENGIFPPRAAKVIMTSALSDSENILGSFSNQCEAYLIKPVEYEQLVAQINLLDLGMEAALK